MADNTSALLITGCNKSSTFGEATLVTTNGMDESSVESCETGAGAHVIGGEIVDAGDSACITTADLIAIRCTKCLDATDNVNTCLGDATAGSVLHGKVIHEKEHNGGTGSNGSISVCYDAPLKHSVEKHFESHDKVAFEESAHSGKSKSIDSAEDSLSDVGKSASLFICIHVLAAKKSSDVSCF